MVSDIELAKQRLQAGLDELSRCAAEIHRWAGVYQERAQIETEEAKRELVEYARDAQAPPQLRKLQEQIDRGELSWYGALLGEADGVMDPSALRFLREQLGEMTALAQAARSGVLPQEPAEGGQPR